MPFKCFHLPTPILPIFAFLSPIGLKSIVHLPLATAGREVFKQEISIVEACLVKIKAGEINTPPVSSCLTFFKRFLSKRGEQDGRFEQGDNTGIIL